MARIDPCYFCNEPVEIQNEDEDYVVYRKDHEGQPQQLAHYDCYKIAMEHSRKVREKVDPKTRSIRKELIR